MSSDRGDSGGFRPWNRIFRTFTAIFLLFGLQLPVQALGVDVRLINGLSGKPLADQRVDAKRKNKDGKFKWAARSTSNASGVATFSLDAGTYRFQKIASGLLG